MSQIDLSLDTPASTWERVAQGPFLKWIGGKAGLLDQIGHHLPRPHGGRGYRQPFLGGGTPFWQIYSAVRPVVLSDTNQRLVDTYIAVRDHANDVIRLLAEHQPKYNVQSYQEAREAVNTGRGSLVERAAWFFVINRWGFNGLWRENQRGECNVPFGKTESGRAPVLCDPTTLRECSRALAGVEIRHEPFEATLADATDGEAVYFDPPYAPVSKTADFTAYTAGGFSYGRGRASREADARTDHNRLLDALAELDRRGVAWALSNADTDVTRAAYKRWHIVEVRARRSVNSDATKRGSVGELLVLGRHSS